MIYFPVFILWLKETDMNKIQSVWIEDGCIFCHACESALPSVFFLPQDGAEILGAVRTDRKTSPNNIEKCELNLQGISLSEEIIEAAEGCPIEIIKFIRAA